MSAPIWPEESTTCAGEARERYNYLLDAGVFPTFSSTGTENYFRSGYKLDDDSVDDPMNSRYREFTTHYYGLPQVLRFDGTYGR